MKHTFSKYTLLRRIVIFFVFSYAFSLLAIEITLHDRNEYGIPLKLQETKTCTNIYEENKARYFQGTCCAINVCLW
jgi:hypothetical protein